MPTPSPRIWGLNATSRRLLSGTAVLACLMIGIGAARRGDGPVPPAPLLRVDPNAAPAEVLAALPRIGPVLAGRIVSARQQAPLRSLADLDRRVRGIGPVTIEAIRPYLVFEPAEAEDEAHRRP